MFRTPTMTIQTLKFLQEDERIELNPLIPESYICKAFYVERINGQTNHSDAQGQELDSMGPL